MARAKRRLADYPLHTFNPSASWTVVTEYRVHGRLITPGSEVSVHGERGRFRFIKHVTTEAGVEWLDFIGGPNKAPMFRSFRSDKIKRVHRIMKTRESLQAQLQEAA